MSPVVILLITIVAISFIGVVVLIGVRASRLSRELEATERKVESLQGEASALSGSLAAAQAEDRRKIGWLDNLEQENTWMRAELERRPKITRKTYKILTLGVKATGKTSLTLKWSNPLIDLGMLEGTKIERYERTVSHVPQKDVVIEHVFEVHDWGGEHIVDAQQELIVEEIHGLLIVVDLGGKDATAPEPSRIQEQLQEFQAQALKYFFGPKTVASCKTVVLFINKSDLLAGTPAQVEEQAQALYTPLIENLKKYSNQIDVRVFVGSANYGHSTHLLFSHFVERILPKNAYDNQLLQRMKSDFSATRVPAQGPSSSPTVSGVSRMPVLEAPKGEPARVVAAPAKQPVAPNAPVANASATAEQARTVELKQPTVPLQSRPKMTPPVPRKA